MSVTRAAWVAVAVAVAAVSTLAQSGPIGSEAAIPKHLRDGEEFTRTVSELIAYGARLFTANWTDQDGGGRPLSKGSGQPLSDLHQPLRGPRAFNRISGPDANSCYGCHNSPDAMPGGKGDVTTNSFEDAQRFDFVTFDRKDATITGGALNERGRPVSLETVGRSRSTPDLFGAGYIEMLARQMTVDLQRIRDTLQPGQSRPLVAKGVEFGTLARRANGRWDTRNVRGLPAVSLATNGGAARPSLVIRPWQSGTAASIRDVTNMSLNQHHGIQTTERFGRDTDPDGDGVVNEMTRADVTALTLFEATLPVPGRVSPDDPAAKRAASAGERVFERLQCGECHVPGLPLDQRGWIYSEPGPYNTAGSARPGRTPIIEVDLTDPRLPQPRLVASGDAHAVVLVPAYTDLRVHDITDASDLGGTETTKQEGDAGGRMFLTRRLWTAGGGPPYFHHGLFTTLRRAILAHAGEALQQRQAFEHIESDEQDALIEFLKSLQALPPARPK